jgi:NCS1 family nucleobase:cation symporter-1
VPNIPGFLTTIKLIPPDAFPAWLSHLYNYAWFVGFFIAAFVYMLLMRKYQPLVPDSITVKEKIAHVAID